MEKIEMEGKRIYLYSHQIDMRMGMGMGIEKGGNGTPPFGFSHALPPRYKLLL